MEARRTFVGGSMSKGLIVVMAVCAAAGLGAGGALVAKNLTGSGTAANGVSHAAPQALPLRQDNDYPVISRPALTDRGAERGFVQTHDGRRGGTIDSAGVGDTADGNGPTSDLTRVLPVSGPIDLPLWLQKEMGTSQQSSDKIVVDQNYIDQYLSANPGWDARSVREGHGA